MRLVDPGIELVACGSSGRQMPTFGRWEDEVLEQAYDDVDYLSLHAYYEEHDGDLDSFLASSVDMDAFIDEVAATCDAVRARTGSRRRIRLSFDEWNVWCQRQSDPAERREFVHAPRLIEDEYDVADAVVVGSFLMSLLRHADRVAIACQAQLVNVIAPIRAEPAGPAWRQSIFDPFALTARLARGRALRVEPRGPLHRTRRHGDVPVVDVAAALAEDGEVALFAVNRHPRDAQVLEVDLRAVPDAVVAEHWQLADPDPRARNTEQHPERVRARPAGTAMLVDGRLRVPLPPVSWSALRLRRREGTS